MNNPIDKQFISNKKQTKIMTHVIAGYPNWDICADIINLMSSMKVDFIEIQIPFTDSLADGSTIMNANQKALDNGVTPLSCLDFVNDISRNITTPLLFMTYANIPIQIGMKRFIYESAKSGICGLIIPDLPFDHPNDNYIPLCHEFIIHPILIVSQNMNKLRLAQMIKFSSGFIYSTLKIGITGTKSSLSSDGYEFMNEIKKQTKIPVMAGFGICDPLQIRDIKDFVEGVVIGSHLLRVFNRGGMQEVQNALKNFIDSLD